MISCSIAHGSNNALFVQSTEEGTDLYGFGALLEKLHNNACFLW
jgi:hypothetical protein